MLWKLLWTNPIGLQFSQAFLDHTQRYFNIQVYDKDVVINDFQMYDLSLLTVVLKITVSFIWTKGVIRISSS